MWTGAAGKCLTWSSHELGHYFFGLLFGLSTHLPDKNFFALYVNLDFSRVRKSAMPMEIRSSDFQNGRDIPKKYTCGGQDPFPPISWENSPPTRAAREKS